MSIMTTVGIDDWIKATLLHSVGVVEQVEDRIFFDVAPERTKYPFVVIQQQSARHVRGVGPYSVLLDTLYIVKAVAQVTTYTPLVPLVTAMNAVLITPPGEDGDLSCVAEEPFRLASVEEGVQFRQLGTQYRIQAAAA